VEEQQQWSFWQCAQMQCNTDAVQHTCSAAQCSEVQHNAQQERTHQSVHIWRSDCRHLQAQARELKVKKHIKAKKQSPLQHMVHLDIPNIKDPRTTLMHWS